ncbi:MAG: carbohydrate ABC transporter permease [Spirochaetales bacterium]|nr:carbohydrate ABC transporter permease [Spirochaetales bacterium]
MIKKAVNPLVAVLLVLNALAAVMPFVYMALVSLTQKQMLDFHFAFSEFSLINYERVFRNFNILTNFRNSLIVTGSACFLNNIVSSMAAYAFAKKQFPFRDRLFFIYLATLMIPAQVTLIPVFIMIKNLGMMNTYPALFLPIINAFGIFLVRQFLVALPNDLLEAAKIDGCGDLRIFITIVLPLLKTVLVSLTIFTFITSWNDFLWPLVIAGKPEMKTLTLAVSALKGTYSTNYGLVMAGSTMTFLTPFILFLFLQKMFIEGIALSGIKG